MYSARYSCQILKKLEYSRQIFEKNIPISNFTKFRPVGAELFHAEGRTDGQTDRHGEDNSRFSKFCDRA
jgi:hypothetical protein